MAAHRYWRLYVTASKDSSDYFAISNVEFRESIGGADACTVGERNSRAFDSVGNYDANSSDARAAFNDNTSDWEYVSPVGLPQFLMWDFGAAGDKDIVEVYLEQDSENYSNQNRAPKDFSIEYSDDNSAWTELFAVVGEVSWSGGSAIAFSDPGPLLEEVITEGINTLDAYGTVWPSGKRYWRYTVEAIDPILNSGEVIHTGVRYLEFRETVGSSGNENMNGTLSASTEGNGAAINALDPSNNHWRTTDAAAMPQWLKYDFGLGDHRDIKSFYINVDGGLERSRPTSLLLESSNDDTNWIGVGHSLLVSTWTENSRIIEFLTTENSNILVDSISASMLTRYSEEYDDLLSEIINSLDSTTSIKARVVSLLDNIEITTSLLYEYITGIVELAAVSDSVPTSASLVTSISEVINIQALIRIQFLMELIESLTGTDTLALLKEGYSSVDENIGAITQALSQLIANGNAISDSIEVDDILGYSFIELLSEVLNTSSDLLPQLIASQVELSGVEVSPVLVNELIMSMGVNELSNIIDGTGTNAVLSSSLEDYITFSFSVPDTDESYYGWTYSPESKSVTNYDLNFSELTSYKDNTYLANGSGLYMMEGQQDAGSYIQSKVTTAGLTFGKRTEKQVPQVFLGVGGTNHIVSVSVDERDTVYYELASRMDDGLSTKTLKLGKGLIGNTWQFSIVDVDQLDFDLDSLEFYPVFLKRKHR